MSAHSARSRADEPVRVVVAGVRSTTHLVHAASWLRHLAEREPGPVVVDYRGSGPFLGRDNVDAGDARRLLGLDGQLAYRAPGDGAGEPGRPGRRRVLLSVGAPGIKPYLRLLRADPAHRPEVVVVDEGLGSYGTWRTRRAAYRRQGGREPWPTVRSVAVSGAGVLLTGTRWALYEQQQAGQWRLSAAVSAEFRRRLTGSPAPAGRAVYLTQPWTALGLLTPAAFRAHLAEVEGACARAGLDLVVRPHPAERREAYDGVVLDPGHGPAELDRAVVSSAVLGSDSTALLNVAALYGTPAVRVWLPELALLDRGLAPRQRSLLDAFLPAPVPLASLTAALTAARPSEPRE